MTTVPIPSWNALGVIPPFNATSPTSVDRSPYVASLSEFILRFSTSDVRRRVLDGFLRYRGRLHAVGLTDGFQWLDGSFLENIEVVEGRSPNDLDLVTFFRLPAGTSQAEVQRSAPDAFPQTSAERSLFKSVFFVDPYFVNLGAAAERLIKLSTYWHSVWSHRRDATWKGYLQIDLNLTEDSVAANQLNLPPITGGTP